MQFWATKIKNDAKAPEDIQRKTTKHAEGLGSLFCKEWWGLISLERRRLRGNITALFSSQRRGSGERGAKLFSLQFSNRVCGNSSKLHQGRFRLDIRNLFFLRGWSNPGTGFLERWLIP